MRILLTGGGTAGHVNPALAIAATIREHDPKAEVAFAASAQPTDKAVDLVGRAGYPLHKVHIRGMARPLWKPSNLGLPFYMARSKAEAGKIIDAFRPDLIVGTGGYACWPVCSVGVKRGIPTALHESNALPGKAIMRLSGKVDLVLVNFPETVDRLGGQRKHPRTGKDTILRVGNPMMPGFATLSRAEARQKLGLSPRDVFILSFGGSGGAEYVNDAVVELADTLAAAPAAGQVRLLHAAGKRDYDRIRADWDATAAGTCPRMTLVDYIYDMPIRMAAADLVISRAGSMSLSELAIMGKASVLIPSPYVAEQHQLKNAMALVREFAAFCVEEHTLAEGALTSTVRTLLADPTLRTDMEKRIRAFATPDANESIYQALVALIQ